MQPHDRESERDQADDDTEVDSHFQQVASALSLQKLGKDNKNLNHISNNSDNNQNSHALLQEHWHMQSHGQACEAACRNAANRGTFIPSTLAAPETHADFSNTTLAGCWEVPKICEEFWNNYPWQILRWNPFPGFGGYSTDFNRQRYSAASSNFVIKSYTWFLGFLTTIWWKQRTVVTSEGYKNMACWNLQPKEAIETRRSTICRWDSLNWFLFGLNIVASLLRHVYICTETEIKAVTILCITIYAIFSACHLSCPLFIPPRNQSFCNISCFQRFQQTEAETIYIDIYVYWIETTYLDSRACTCYIDILYQSYNHSISLTKNNLPRHISVPWFCASFRPLHALIAKAKALSGDISFTWRWWTWHVRGSPTFHEGNPYNCYVKPYYCVDDQKAGPP